MNLQTQRMVFNKSRDCSMAVRGMTVQNTNTQLSGNTVSIASGGDTTLQGATASANKVTGTVGGNLNLSSLQDTSRYKENSQSSGFSVSVPITGGAASASVSHSKTKIDSTYQSVGEQTAIRAGDGGFDVNVQGSTSLTGGQITSTDKVSCPSVRNTLCVEFQPLFFQRSASRGWSLIGLRHFF